MRWNASALAESGDAVRSHTTTRPPGRHTRRIAASTAAGCWKWWNAKRDTTTEKVPSSHGRCVTSPSVNVTFVTPAAAATSRARASIAGVTSIPVACRTARANAPTTRPGPQATSRTVSSGPAPLASTRRRRAASSRMPGAVENGTAWRVNWSRMRSRCDDMGVSGVGAMPGQGGIEPVVAPEQLLPADERRRPEDAALDRLLGLLPEALLVVGRLGGGQQRGGVEPEPREQRADHLRLRDLPVIREVRVVHRAHEARR